MLQELTGAAHKDIVDSLVVSLAATYIAFQVIESSLKAKAPDTGIPNATVWYLNSEITTLFTIRLPHTHHFSHGQDTTWGRRVSSSARSNSDILMNGGSHYSRKGPFHFSSFLWLLSLRLIQFFLSYLAHVDQWNRIEDPNIYPHSYAQNGLDGAVEEMDRPDVRPLSWFVW
ncbi:hypothetical protein STEG23_022992 [Scotinomys teguina]